MPCFLFDLSFRDSCDEFSIILYRDDSDSVSGTRDSFSDSFSDESESEKLSRWDGCSSEEGFEQEFLWHHNNRLGNLYFQHFESSTPYGRVPLMDKVSFYHFLRSEIVCLELLMSCVPLAYYISIPLSLLLILYLYWIIT